MPHPNLSPQLSNMVDGQVMYRYMAPGSIIHVTALNSLGLIEGTFRIQVVAVIEVEPGQHKAIFCFKGDNFHFFDGKNEPVIVSAGTLAESGVSATLYPQMVLFMVMLGGIGIGRDYSFEMVGGENVSVVAHGIKNIMVEEPPANWEAPDISAFIAQVADIRQTLEEEKATYNEFRRQGLRVRTVNSVYYFTPADQNFGTRTIRKEGGESCQGRLIYAEVGKRMEFDNFDNDQTVSTSEVLEITPWSEDQETTE